jgi:hypothetical protein
MQFAALRRGGSAGEPARGPRSNRRAFVETKRRRDDELPRGSRPHPARCMQRAAGSLRDFPVEASDPAYVRTGPGGRPDLEIDEDAGFQVRTARWRRVAWIVLAAVLVAGLAGWSSPDSRETILRTLFLYLFLLFVFRMAGTHTLGRITTFDFVLLLVIAETTGQVLLRDGHSIPMAVLAILTLVGLDIGLALLKQRWQGLDRWIEGTPVILVEDGVPLAERLRREQIDVNEILCSAREHHGLQRMDQIRYAILERSGAISIVPRRQG